METLLGTRVKDFLIVIKEGDRSDICSTFFIYLFRLLTSLGMHVITFDYRAFGDSTPVNLRNIETFKI